MVDKENGGKADALNAGLNFARYPLFCGVDADSLLDPEVLLRASRLFLEDERVLAVGGTIRPLNGARIREGIVEELRLPRGFLEKIQVIEYARAFFMGRAGWSAMNALLIISGAFGLFRRSEAIKVGGAARTPWGRTWSWWSASTGRRGKRGGTTGSSIPRTPSATRGSPPTGPP